MDEEDFQKLSIEDKCSSKLWKARLSGYEDAAKLFRQLDDEKSPEWGKYVSQIKKFVVDPNAPAQEKGLEAVLAFVENYIGAGKTVVDVMAALIQKGVGATKPRTKELSSEIALTYIEIEKYDSVIDELLKGTENKNPKIVCGCLSILSQALSQFGPKVINVNKILKKIPTTLADRDKTVRVESKNLYVEICNWIGNSVIKPHLSTLKPAQLTELESELEKIKSLKTVPPRLLKSQQAKKAAAAAVKGSLDTGEPYDYGDNEEVEHDPTEFLEPVDVLTKLPKDFYVQLEAKKWSERKDPLDTLAKELSQAPKLETGDYSELIRALKKVVAKDSNVLVVAVALKCITDLAAGLKKKFGIYVGGVMPTLIEKFKEKKQIVVIGLRETVDAVYLTTQLDHIAEELLTGMNTKNPCVKNEVIQFIIRCFTRSSPASLNKKLLKSLTAALVLANQDSDPSVRESSLAALGTAMKVVGEKALLPFLGDKIQNDVKLITKIREYCDKAEIIKPIRQPSSRRPNESDVKSKFKSDGDSEQPSIKTRSKTLAERTALKSKIDLEKNKSLDTRNSSLPLDMCNTLSFKLPQSVLNALVSVDEPTRTEGHLELLQIVKKSSLTTQMTNDVLKLLILEPGFKEIQRVVEIKIEILKFLANQCNLLECNIEPVILELQRSFSSINCDNLVSSCLHSIAIKGSDPDKIAHILLREEVIGDDNLWILSLNWISELIVQYGLSFSKDYLDIEANKALTAKNSFVRKAGLALMGSTTFIGNPPTREGDASIVTSKIKVPKGKPKPVTHCAGVKDINEIISPNLVTELSDDNWKVRHDALTKVINTLELYDMIGSELGHLQNVIEELLIDKNSKVVTSTLTLLSSISRKIGPDCRHYTRLFIPKVIKNYSDTKAWVRSAVTSTLNTWGSTAGYKEFFDNENIADIVKTTSGTAFRIELWNWLASALQSVPSVPIDGLIALLPYLFQQAEERNCDVRKAACDAVSSFALHIGPENLLSYCDNLKGPSGQIKSILEKTCSLSTEQIENVSRPPSAQQSAKCKFGPGSSATYTKSAKPKPNANSARSLAPKKKDDDSNTDSGPILEKNNLKNQRVQDEQKLKVLRWNFTTPRPEFIELLKDQVTAASFNHSLFTYMFHYDFKYHIKAIDILSEDLMYNKEGLISNLDLILRWMTLRFFDTNPSVLLRGLNYLNCVFTCLIDDGYNLLDSEATSFIPYLLTKAGDPKDAVRNQVRHIFRLIGSLYPRTKLVSFLMEALKAKNARQRAEILEQMGWLIENYSLSVCYSQPFNQLKEIAQHIGERDTSVRNAALNCLVAVYFLEGDKLFKYIGQLSQKDMSLLEERIKRVSKNRPVASVKPLQPEPPVSDSISSQHLISEPEEQQYSVSQEIVTVTPTSSQESDVSTPVKRPFGLDLSSIVERETCAVDFQPPEIASIDLNFLKDPSTAKHIATSQSLQASFPPTRKVVGGINFELNQILNKDLEKAINVMAQLETILYSDKAHSLLPYLDTIVLQLVQQLIMLNQSTHPDLVNCYRGNFALIMKLSDNRALCQEISEKNLYKLIKQLLLLLTDHRLEDIGQDMFIKVVNNVVIRLLESANKTSVLCALLRMLRNTINPPSSKHFQELVTKCLWKLNRAQPLWDIELNYSKILLEIHAFLKDYPSSWWKNQESDVPLRTMKTFLHTMVKLRGNQVKIICRQIPGLPSDAEMVTYIHKVVKHLKLEEENICDKMYYHSDYHDELSEIIQFIAASKESSEGMNRLKNYLRNNPGTNIEQYIRKLPTSLQQTIKSGLLRDTDSESQNGERLNSEKHEKLLTREYESFWNRLGQWKEMTGCPAEKKEGIYHNSQEKSHSENLNDSLQSSLDANYDILKRRIENIKASKGEIM